VRAALHPQNRGGTDVPRESSAAARLELAEALLSSEDAVECARAAVDWLADRAGARKAICALIDAESGTLQHVFASGVSQVQLESLHLALEEPDHPLVFALAGREPVNLGPKVRRNGAAADTWRNDLLAIPLPMTDKREAREGLLLVSPAARCETEARWAADLLGQKIARLRATAALGTSEHRLQRERELLLNIINASPDPILLTDPEGRMIISNARADALFSSKEGQSEGRQRAVTLNNMLFSAALSQQAIDESGASRRELLLVSPSEGSDLLFELLSSVVQHPREGTCVVSILRNVTDLRSATEQIEENFRRLKVAEADVRAERDRLDLIIDSVADPILVTDPGGKILLMNSPAERLFTAPSASDESAQAERAVRSNDAHFSSFVSNLFLTGTGLRFRGEISLTDPVTLAPLPVEAVAGSVLSEHGEVTAVVTILHDRTEAIEKARLYEQVKAASQQLEEKVRVATAELVRRNELLQRQHLELEQASQLKSQFLANMSHEFRTPLNAILGYTSMLLQGVSGDMSPPQKNKLLRVDSNARHLLSIINDILDISRIEAGKMPLHLEEFDLGALIAELFAEVEPLIQRAKLQVFTDLQQPVPQLYSDRQKVKQVVLNLLTNAIKFTPEGHVKVVVRDDPNGEVRIAVQDTGIGIASVDQGKVFEDFRQADNSVTREYGGAGLGLAICRRLAKMLDGRIELKSQPGEGSAFTLVIPRRGKRR
jgi:signal transduction histidine kinase